jgi:hypothetical protein
MRILGTVVFSLGVVFLLIGIHQSMMVGFKESYWLFMLSFIMLMVYQWVTPKKVETQENVESSKKSKKAKARK